MPRGSGAGRQDAGGSKFSGREVVMSAVDAVARLQSAEIDVFGLLAEHLQTRCMIDVGAHHGSTLLPFLHAGWRVFAFEPVEANRSRLLARCGASERLTVRPEAVSDHSGTVAFHLALSLDGSLDSPYHSLERTRADRYHRKGDTVAVAAVSLDDLAARSELPHRVGFLKIDTEGHDLAVLRGAAGLDCEVISVEFWGERHPLGRSPSPASDMVRLLAERGYDSYLVLWHDADRTHLLDSTLQGLPANAWGNLVFFRSSHQALYRQILDRCQAATATPVPAAADRRLLRLLGSLFPEKSGLVVAEAGSAAGDQVAELRQAFPQSSGVGLDLGSAGKIDLVRIGAGGDGLGDLRAAWPRLGADEPALLVNISFAAGGAQASLAGLLEMLPEYRLAGFVNLMLREEGSWDSADAVLLPPALYARCGSGVSVSSGPDPEELLEQGRQLQQACDQRGALIEQLQQTCAERLALIEQLQEAAAERLRTIEGLDREAGRLGRAVNEQRAKIASLTAAVARLSAEVASRPPRKFLPALRWFLRGGPRAA
jgi:FkbM family methyltransferase